jgi:hypothetical protein
VPQRRAVLPHRHQHELAIRAQLWHRVLQGPRARQPSRRDAQVRGRLLYKICKKKSVFRVRTRPHCVGAFNRY